MTAVMKLKDAYSLEGGFSSGHVWMRKLDCEECLALKNWWFWTVVLEKFLESPLDWKEVQPVHPKENQSWIFNWSWNSNTWATWYEELTHWKKDPDAGKDWRQEDKGMTEDEMVGWHHRLNGFEFEQATGIGDRQGSLACCSPWGRKESDMSEHTAHNP